MRDTPYCIGIDLGTTNSSVAYVKRKGRWKSSVKIFDIPQWVKPGQMEAMPTLPSFLYLPTQYDFAANSLALPWDESRNFVVGHLAKEQGAKIPHRLIHSAKSWLCHSGVDRYQEILPWGSPSEVPKLSPVEVCARYLSFMKETWNHFQAKSPEEYFERQSIVLTVPASFDPVARQLTLEAAGKAGLEDVSLLEEPLAAFYAWIHASRKTKKIEDGMLALVCDVGGGTTDFSLLRVHRSDDQIRFSRVAVGEHLLLGGDNMDLALALYLEQTQAKKKLDSIRFLQLTRACSQAKEMLWQEHGPDSQTFSIQGAGSAVVAQSLKFTLHRDDLEKIVLEGFFPWIPWDETGRKMPAKGFQEWGLPYETDPVIPRHLRLFLQRHLSPGEKPHLVLFNGGVFFSKILRDRLATQIGQWFTTPQEEWAPQVLQNDSPDLAVALGAAYFQLVRRGEGIAISAPSAHSYFLEVREAQKGGKPCTLCLLPFGAETGESFRIDQHPLEVMAQEPVSFPWYASSLLKEAKAGDLVEVREEMVGPYPIVTTIHVGRKAKNKLIPVVLETRLTEIGTLELWLLAQDSDRRWQLQFQIRQNLTPIKKETPREEFPASAVQEILNAAFVAQTQGISSLAGRLEDALSRKKNQWDLETNRKLGDLLLDYAKYRKVSPQHEERWLNLTGFCLRPGIGFPGDEGRIKKLIGVLQEKIGYEKNIQSYLQWWILWRRVAAGLNGNIQMEIFRSMAPYLLEPGSSWIPKKSILKYTKEAEMVEMWYTASSFESLPLSLREDLGKILLHKIGQGFLKHEYWALGRLGARKPFYGQNVLSREIVSSWIRRLLQHEDASEYRLYALAQMARKTEDRAIDIDDDLREEVLQLLHEKSNLFPTQSLIQIVVEAIDLASPLQSHYFGDSLPAGLILKQK